MRKTPEEIKADQVVQMLKELAPRLSRAQSTALDTDLRLATIAIDSLVADQARFAASTEEFKENQSLLDGLKLARLILLAGGSGGAAFMLTNEKYALEEAVVVIIVASAVYFILDGVTEIGRKKAAKRERALNDVFDNSEAGKVLNELIFNRLMSFIYQLMALDHYHQSGDSANFEFDQKDLEWLYTLSSQELARFTNQLNNELDRRPSSDQDRGSEPAYSY